MDEMDPAEAVYEYQLQAGVRVRHQKYGEGVIKKTTGSGENLKLTIYFHEAGFKKMVARYARLSLI